MPLTVTVDPANETAIELRLGPHTFPLLLDSPRSRDLAVLCTRMFAGPNCPSHVGESDDENIASAGAEQTEGAARPRGDGRTSVGDDGGEGGVKDVDWSDGEKEGEVRAQSPGDAPPAI